MKSSKLCSACGQPIKPGRHKPNEYEHAAGCERDKSKKRERAIEVLADGTMRDLSPAEVRAWRKQMRKNKP